MTPRILVLAGYFLPGYKGGGPVQSISNLVDALGDDIDFRVVALDRDLGDSEPYAGLPARQWLDRARYRVIYLPARHLSPRSLRRLIQEVEPSTIYGTGFFAYRSSILPAILKRLGLIPEPIRLVIAPRGEFSPGALGIRARKKKAFLWLANALGLHSGVIWHATTVEEAGLIQKTLRNANDVRIVQNLPVDPAIYGYSKAAPKRVGELHVVWISRVHPKKNLADAIRFVQEVKGEVTLTILGPLEDEKYWRECTALINGSTSEARIEYGGEVNHQDVILAFREAHLFLFPTFGENFGHVIVEALMGGCPVITSDQTPWHDLEREGVGFSLPLSSGERFVEVLQHYVDMTAEQYDSASRKAYEYAQKRADRSSEVAQYRNLFGQEVKCSVESGAK